MKIKNYGKLIPVVLFFLMLLATFQTVSEAQEQEKAYTDYIEKAREKSEQEILTDALSNYEKALEMYSTPELYEEAGAVIETLGTYRQKEKWGKRMIEVYPEEGAGYEYLMQVYLDQKKYASCFEIYDTALKKNVLTKGAADIYEEIKYVYELDYNSYEEVSVFAGGFCAVRKDGLWGFVNEKAVVKIKCRYADAGIFAGGLAYVRDGEGKQYFINADNNKKLAVDNILEAEVTGIINDGWYPVKTGEEYYYCDEEGKPVLGPYLGAGSFNLGRAAVLAEDGWYFIDTQGKILTEERYQNVFLDAKGIAFRNGRAFVASEEGIRMMDENFLPVGDAVYEAARPFYESTMAAVKIDGKWGFTDNTGKLCIPCGYEDADSFSNGYAAVCLDEKWGYINAQGEIVIEPVFSGAAPFNAKGCAFVRRNESWVALRLTKDNW